MRPMARDRGCPRVLHRPIRAARALKDASDDCRILDQRDESHRPHALGAFQGISLIDFANELR